MLPPARPLAGPAPVPERGGLVAAGCAAALAVPARIW